MSFVARSIPPSDRDDNGRSVPLHTPADPFLSALLALVDLEKITTELLGSVVRGREQCKMRRTEALDLSLTVIRSRAEDIRKQTLALQAKLAAHRADQIDDATQVYGV